MNGNTHFDVLIVVTPDDCQRVLPLYPRLVKNFEYGKLCFIGAPKVGEIVGESAIKDHSEWLDENELIPFDDVHACMSKRLAAILGGDPLPRGVTGWYYQQFLKMQYAFACKDEYYMVWDGDTIPCKKISMFNSGTGQPFLDLKHEYHPEYFDTLSKILPGFSKVIERSFISEHMLFRCDIMRSLISDIEKNSSIPGERFWEKIINSIEPEKIYDSSFSEFETYGTYAATKFPEAYALREWHSFRLGASFFDMNTICDRDFRWLAVDFDAISFEKDQSCEGNTGYFDNPKVQKKISAKKLLQAAQMEFVDAYKEVWDDDPTVKDANVRTGSYQEGQENKSRNKTLIVIVTHNELDFIKRAIGSIRNTLDPDTYKVMVVDNASTDGTADWLESQEDILFAASDTPMDYGIACYQAVEATKDSELEDYDVFLMRSDTVLVYDSLYFLKQALYSSDKIGAAGSVSNFAGNKQRLNITFKTDDEYIKYGEKINVPMENPYLERTRLFGFSMLIRRKAWEEIDFLGEDFPFGCFEDALSMEILRHGFRLLLVRNSFVYRKENKDVSWDEDKELFADRYGFDITNYACASGTVISQIPYAHDGNFAVLHYGCGLGAELKAIRSIFPNSEQYGVETNPGLYEIGKKTEKIFASFDELMGYVDHPFFGVLIIDKDILLNMNEAERGMLAGLLLPNSAILVKNEEYEAFPYDDIKLVVWDMDNTFWQGKLGEGDVILPMSNVELVKNMAEHGVASSIFTKNDREAVMNELENAGIARLFSSNDIGTDIGMKDMTAKLEKLGISPENTLYIDDDSSVFAEARAAVAGLKLATPDIIPYLSTHFSRM